MISFLIENFFSCETFLVLDLRCFDLNRKGFFSLIIYVFWRFFVSKNARNVWDREACEKTETSIEKLLQV